MGEIKKSPISDAINTVKTRKRQSTLKKQTSWISAIVSTSKTLALSTEHNLPRLFSAT